MDRCFYCREIWQTSVDDVWSSGNGFLHGLYNPLSTHQDRYLTKLIDNSNHHDQIGNQKLRNCSGPVSLSLQHIFCSWLARYDVALSRRDRASTNPSSCKRFIHVGKLGFQLHGCVALALPINEPIKRSLTANSGHDHTCGFLVDRISDLYHICSNVSNMFL